MHYNKIMENISNSNLIKKTRQANWGVIEHIQTEWNG